MTQFINIIKSLEKPLLDPRDELVKPILKSDILTIDNLGNLNIKGFYTNEIRDITNLKQVQVMTY